ncbi:hypothetical protein JTB14_001922, partial [Gonioctena quinquepunctata]
TKNKDTGKDALDQTPSVELQIKESLSTIGAETGNPFSRRDSIQRTPPRTPSGSRTSTISSLSDIQDKVKPEKSPLLEQSVKRKKNNPSPEPKKRNEVKDRGDILKTTIERMMDQIEKLNRVVKEMYKPKQEVKEVASGEVDKENRVVNQNKSGEMKTSASGNIYKRWKNHIGMITGVGLQLAPNAKNAGKSPRKKRGGTG